MSIAIPRIRDFRGLNPRSFDGRGNYSMGVREQIIFPEIDYDAIDQVRGLDVTITTSAADRRGGLRAAARARHAVPREGAPGTAAEAAEARRGGARKEERAAEAEAEQAALEQLKEENPEAYEKPEPQSDEGEEARPSPRRGTGVDGKDVTGGPPAARPKYKTRNYNRCKRCGRPRAYYRKFGLCRICLREIAHEGMIPGMTKSSW